jgi:hypothetical protein
MRKIKFVTMATALVAVTTLWSSCQKSDEPVNPNEVSEVAPELFSVVASANAEAVFSVNVGATAETSMDKMSATFSDIDTKNTTVKVTAKLVDPTGYVESTQTATVNFSEDLKSAAVEFDFAKASTDIATQAEVAAATADLVVTSNTTAVDASMVIPAGVDVKFNTTDPFSVTAFEAAPDVVDVTEIEVGKPLPTDDDDVLILDCTPDKASFDKPLTLKVFVDSELAGETIEIENDGEVVSAIVQEDGYAEFKVSHFSRWNARLRPIVEAIVEGSATLLDLADVAVVNGMNTVPFVKNVGQESNAVGMTAQYLKQKFGSRKQVLQIASSFICTSAAKAKIKAVQRYRDITLRFGKKAEAKKVRIWGETVTSVDIEGGGSGSNEHPAGSIK